MNNTRRSLNRFFAKRNVLFLCVFAVIIALYFLSAMITEFQLQEGVKSFPKVFRWVTQNCIPDEKAMQRLPKIINRLIETTLLSVAVTVIATCFAFVMSLLGSGTTNPHAAVNRAVRVFAAFFRNVPDVVWAILLMFSFGQNILTGFFALFFTTFGMLTRFFIEIMDEVSSSSVEALTSTGARFTHIVVQGIIPSTITEIITWVLYMIETNIRNSTLIGILTATGIGYLFDMYYKRMEFASASVVVIATVILVIVIENISNYLRKVIA